MSHRRRDTLPRATRKPTAAKTPVQARRISRREREARQRRRLYLGISVASALVVGILVFSALNEYVFKPRAVVASVEDVDIRRRDYWKVRAVDLINQINQYQQFSQLVDASQQQQYVTLAQQASTELDEVWGSTSLDETTLNRMVEDEIYLQNMEKLGLEVTDADVERYINAQFQPAEAPLISPTPSPTLIPQRAEWATQTAVAESGEVAGTTTPMPPIDGSLVASPVPGVESAPADESTPLTAPPSPVTSPEAVPVESEASASPLASPAGVSSSLEGTPQSGSTIAGGGSASPVASPIASPLVPEATVASATPNPDQALQTAEAGYDAYQDNVFDTAHLSENDYERLIARPAVAREMVRETLTRDVGQTAEQVRAAHILVDTKDLADTIYQTLQDPSVSFEQTAIDQSNDTSTAPNGGDLGWFARGQMVDPFEQSAFSQEVGTISAPVQSEFGWHIIRVYEKNPDRALSDQQLEQYRESLVADWVAQQRASMDVSSDIEPSPTPGVSNFVPPPDAPALPTPTSEVVASPVVDATPAAQDATPVSSTGDAGTPVTVTEASPVTMPTTEPAIPGSSSLSANAPASPIVATTPISTPNAISSPVASPVTSGLATPLASPVGTPIA